MPPTEIGFFLAIRASNLCTKFVIVHIKVRFTFGKFYILQNASFYMFYLALNTPLDSLPCSS